MTDQIPPDQMNAMIVFARELANQHGGEMVMPDGGGFSSQNGDAFIRNFIRQYVKPDDLLPKPVNGPDGDKAHVHRVDSNSIKDCFKVCSGRWTLDGDIGETKIELINRWNDAWGGCDE